jgi:hypothetical protein
VEDPAARASTTWRWWRAHLDDLAVVGSGGGGSRCVCVCLCVYVYACVRRRRWRAAAEVACGSDGQAGACGGDGQAVACGGDGQVMLDTKVYLVLSFFVCL